MNLLDGTAGCKPAGSRGGPPLDALLPEKGLRRGTLVKWVTAGEGTGARTLALADFTKHIGTKDLSRACHHVRRAEKAGLMKMIGLVGGWVGGDGVGGREGAGTRHDTDLVAHLTPSISGGEQCCPLHAILSPLLFVHAILKGAEDQLRQPAVSRVMPTNVYGHDRTGPGLRER